MLLPECLSWAQRRVKVQLTMSSEYSVLSVIVSGNLNVTYFFYMYRAIGSLVNVAIKWEKETEVCCASAMCDDNVYEGIERRSVGMVQAPGWTP